MIAAYVGYTKTHMQMSTEQKKELENTHRGLQQGQSDEGQQIGNMTVPRLRIMLHPSDQRLKHLVLRQNVQIVAGQQLGELLSVQLEELLVVADLRKVLTCEVHGDVLQRDAVLLFGEQSESQTIRRMQLATEERATSCDNAAELEQTGCAQKRFHGVLAQFDVTRVTVVDKGLQRVARHLAQGHLLLRRFLQQAGEHGTEVGAAR